MHSLKNVLLGLAMAVLAACGSEKKEPEPITAPERPNIEQGPANAVSYVEGSYDRPYKLAVSSDAWYLVDRSQGIIRVDQATQESEVIAKFKANDAESLIESAAAIELNGDESALFVLDTEAKQIVSIDLISAEQTQFVASEAFAVSDNFAWYAPTDLVMDSDNGRLLVGDRYGFIGQGYFAFAIFSVDVATQDVSVIAESSLVASPLQGFEARAFTYDAIKGDFYASGLVNLSNRYYYAAYSISESDWSRKLLSLNSESEVSRSAATHDVYFSEDSGVFLIDSNARTIVNLNIDGETTKARIIELANDGNDFPLLYPSAFHFVDENTVTILDAGTSALLSVDFTITLTLDDDGNETGYRSTSTRTLLASGKKAYADPTSAPQIVFDLHFHQASGKLMITDSAASQAGMLSYTSTDGYSSLILDPQIEGFASTEEPYTYTLGENQGIEDVRPNLTPAPKPIFVASDTDGELIVYGRGFLVESKDPIINEDDDGNPESVTFTYNRYGPAIYIVDIETLEATPISVGTNTDNQSAFVNVPFSSADVKGMAANENGVYFLPNEPYAFGPFAVYYWSYENKTFNVAPVELASDVGRPLPSDITYDAVSGDFVLTDAVNDALLKFNPEERVISTLSGRMNDGDVLFALPSGVATVGGMTAYTYENALKALVMVDMSTGDRTRINSPVNYIRSVSKLTVDTVGKKVYLLEKLSQRIIEIDIDDTNGEPSYEQAWLE